MMAFAGNSLLCRLALKDTSIDAASFTTIRLIAGAVMLWLVTRMRRGPRSGGGNGWSACALFIYAAGFSFAYVSLPAATGALLLFGASAFAAPAPAGPGDECESCHASAWSKKKVVVDQLAL